MPIYSADAMLVVNIYDVQSPHSGRRRWLIAYLPSRVWRIGEAGCRPNPGANESVMDVDAAVKSRHA
jgi:hypothetical protein